MSRRRSEGVHDGRHFREEQRKESESHSLKIQRREDRIRRVKIISELAHVSLYDWLSSKDF